MLEDDPKIARMQALREKVIAEEEEAKRKESKGNQNNERKD